jgi:uncharacterized membrane protein (DUF485 family)
MKTEAKHMKLDANTHALKPSRRSYADLLLPIGLLTPGAGYFIIIVLALFGVKRPAHWLAHEVVTTGWSVAVLLAIVIGSPVLSAVSSLMLRIRRGPGHALAGVCGGGAGLVVVVNALFGFWLWLSLSD